MENGWNVAGDTNLDLVTKYLCRKINEEQRSNTCLFSIVADYLL